MKQTIINAIKEHKLIAIVRGAEADKCIAISQALYEGGFKAVEITYNMKDPTSWEETAKTIGAVKEAFAGKMIVGAGTVTCPELVDLTHKYGGEFIISPNFSEAVVRRTVELGMVSIPGALTPTEVYNAHAAGADFVKLFPAGTMGPGYVKSIKAPLSNIELLATGGIDENNVADYLKAGAVGAGIGGNLVNLKWVAAGEYEKITEVARLLVAAVKE